MTLGGTAPPFKSSRRWFLASRTSETSRHRIASQRQEVVTHKQVSQQKRGSSFGFRGLAAKTRIQRLFCESPTPNHLHHGAICFGRRRDGRNAAIVAACVLTHWLLDYIYHRPDMPFLLHGARYGLGYVTRSQPPWSVSSCCLGLGSRCTSARQAAKTAPVAWPCGRCRFLC